jgi:hypothetical protein
MQNYARRMDFVHLLVASFVPEDRNPRVAMPKLHVVAIHHQLGSLLGVLFIGAQKLMPLQYAAIPAHDEGAIVLHRLLRWLKLGRSQPLAHM